MGLFDHQHHGYYYGSPGSFSVGGYRRNPAGDLSVADVIAVAESMGFDDLAWLLGRDPSKAAELVALINAELAEDEPEPVEVIEAEEIEIEPTDAERWGQLADIAAARWSEIMPSSVLDLGMGVRDAVVAAFRERAAA